MGGVLVPPALDTSELETRVREMYRAVAEAPEGRYHFELGRALADRLGYDPRALDSVPADAVDSFAGVGHFFDLVELRPGESVLDLGSGSGMDAFLAAAQVGSEGRVVGVDMTPEQLAKAERLREAAGLENAKFVEGQIERLSADEASFDAVISNGVINLSPQKDRVFAEAFRVLRPGGRLAIADIIAERALPDDVVCNADLWASCIGGAAESGAYRQAIADAGLILERTRVNPYAFISGQARRASVTYGVQSVSLLARKPA
ncbi:MAG TPA: methyltransferase domain-containing protein [Candidatus Limnocylindria bacterium]|nr:methyltransferase domain-containing protein [Candidatus Limnocylindria bacterium]